MSVEPKVFDHVKKILTSFNDKYMTGDVLKRTAIIEDLDKYDDQLMEALLSDQLIHDTYTKKIAGVEIFEVNQFVSMLEFKDYWEDSYTKYSNKIGLTAGGKFIDENEDVVLDFPYKDCVLKAGMTKEDAKDNDEPFLNEVIAKPEIEEKLEPKMFVNTKKYDKDGVHDAAGIDDSDNLIIKGNNLIALYSLKERYAGKVKLIYLDPPYNTKNGDFPYNDSFNQSSWLTFMKNRIEIARELLQENGSLWLNIDQQESHYLKILTDSIFENGFVGDVAWQKRTSPDARNPLGDAYDHILVYSKNPTIFKQELNRLPLTEKQKSTYKNPDNDPNGPWASSDFTAQGTRPNQMYTITTPGGKQYTPPAGRCWKNIESVYLKQRSEERIWFGKDGNAMPRRKTYLKDREGQVAWTWWPNSEAGNNQEAKKESIKLFGNTAYFATPKPERLLERIIYLGSNEGDLVLDFFMGSATTQAVAMKMHRQFIGIEQMDYINTVSVPRLQKVIKGEQGGISKDVNWQGGGSFVYAELMEKNRGYVKDVMSAEKMSELLDVFERMKATTDFDFRVDLEKFQQELHGFSDVDEARKELLRILDKNQLYYNYANIDDSNVRDLVDDTDYQFNKSFYED